MVDYPSLLRPTATETLFVADQPIVVPKVELAFRPWVQAGLVNYFGHKPLINFAGRPVFAEVCIYELFRLSGWDARWVETYGAPATGPYLFTDWADAPLKHQ